MQGTEKKTVFKKVCY